MTTTTTSTPTSRFPSPSGIEMAGRARQWPKSSLVVLLLLSLLSVLQHGVEVAETTTLRADTSAPLLGNNDVDQPPNDDTEKLLRHLEDTCGLRELIEEATVYPQDGISPVTLNTISAAFADRIKKPKFKLKQFWKKRVPKCSKEVAEVQTKKHLASLNMTEDEVNYTTSIIKRSADYIKAGRLGKIVCGGRFLSGLGKWRSCDKKGAVWRQVKQLNMCRGDKWRVCVTRTEMFNKGHNILYPPAKSPRLEPNAPSSDTERDEEIDNLRKAEMTGEVHSTTPPQAVGGTLVQSQDEIDDLGGPPKDPAPYPPDYRPTDSHSLDQSKGAGAVTGEADNQEESTIDAELRQTPPNVQSPGESNA